MAEPTAFVIGKLYIESVATQCTVVQRICKLEPEIAVFISRGMTQRQKEHAVGCETVAKCVDSEFERMRVNPLLVGECMERAEIVVVAVAARACDAAGSCGSQQERVNRQFIHSLWIRPDLRVCRHPDRCYAVWGVF